MSRDRAHLLPEFDLPQDDVPILVAHGQQAAIRADINPINLSTFARECLDYLAGFDVPLVDGCILSNPGKYSFTIRTEDTCS